MTSLVWYVSFVRHPCCICCAASVCTSKLYFRHIGVRAFLVVQKVPGLLIDYWHRTRSLIRSLTPHKKLETWADFFFFPGTYVRESGAVIYADFSVEETFSQSENQAYSSSRPTWQEYVRFLVTEPVLYSHVPCARKISTRIDDVVIVVFTWNRFFYPATSAVPSVSFLILDPGEIQILWSDSERRTKRR